MPILINLLTFTPVNQYESNTNINYQFQNKFQTNIIPMLGFVQCALVYNVHCTVQCAVVIGQPRMHVHTPHHWSTLGIIVLYKHSVECACPHSRLVYCMSPLDIVVQRSMCSNYTVCMSTTPDCRSTLGIVVFTLCSSTQCALCVHILFHCTVCARLLWASS